jgi:catechol 2,3-dioxygenase-like lactoylglutathione lyase family enzyme
MTTAGSAGAAVLGIDNVLFAVADLDAAVDFYTGTLGLPLIFRLNDAGVALFSLGSGLDGRGRSARGRDQHGYVRAAAAGPRVGVPGRARDEPSCACRPSSIVGDRRCSLPV